jgi:uncharacterized membrane protein
LTYRERRNLWLALGCACIIVGFFVTCIGVWVQVGEPEFFSASAVDIAYYAGPLAVALWLLPVSALALLLTLPLEHSPLRLQRSLHFIGCLVFVMGGIYVLVDFFTTAQMVNHVIRAATAVGCHPEQDIPCYDSTLPARFSVGEGTWVMIIGLIICAYALYLVKQKTPVPRLEVNDEE